MKLLFDIRSGGLLPYYVLDRRSMGCNSDATVFYTNECKVIPSPSPVVPGSHGGQVNLRFSATVHVAGLADGGLLDACL